MAAEEATSGLLFGDLAVSRDDERPLEEMAQVAEVAVPAPIHQTLSYGLPASLSSLAAVGCRVRVSLGKRRVVGVILRLHQEPPSGMRLKPIEEILDLEPVLTTELLQLAKFIADYYLAPIGDAIRVLLPSRLPPWGDRRISLTDAGALALPRSSGEEQLKQALLSRRRVRVAELQRDLKISDLGRLVEELRAAGKLSIDEPGRSGVRYIKAVELRPGDLDQQLALCGRSAKGRAVVDYLHALSRPVTVRDLQSAVGCGAGVVRRLEQLGLLRHFTQPERLSLGHHRMSVEEPREIILRDDQEAAVEPLMQGLASAAYAPFMLHGMTGSGKTEVYLRVARRSLDQGRGVLLLVPEIALVPSLAAVTRERFGRDLAVLHSNLSSAERQQEWERVRQGEARVVLGPRSALFAPLQNIGLIVVDEEHDGSYKQDASPRYNGRDLALWRARAEGAVAVLVSATPSLESRHNIVTGKLAPLVLTRRAGGAELPTGVLVDLRQEKLSRRPGEVHFSARLRGEIGAALEAGDQIILMRNRRGYSPVLLCRACGEDFRCEDCGLPQTFHRRQRALVCHYCASQRSVPRACPACQQEALEPIGAGTERVEEQFNEIFPGVTADVLDADAARRRGGAAAVLERFGSGRSQVLIGTQMVSKGHHFPRVSLAAVLHADTYLGFPDFRAVERTYALLVQLGGRAGRGQRPGKVVIQTYHPDHYAIRAALEHDDEAFAKAEMRFRRVFQYPPFSRMVQLLSQHRDRQRAADLLRDLSQRLRRHPAARDLRITGPAPAAHEKLRGLWRFQLLLRGPNGSHLRRLVREVALADGALPELTIDVDPFDLL